MKHNLKLTDLEKTIVARFLRSKGVNLGDEMVFCDKLSVSKRDFSGVGFMTELNISEKLRIGDRSKSYKWGHLGAKLNNSIDTGYLLYIEGGYLNTIEGYTYAEDWPNQIYEIETYEI